MSEKIDLEFHLGETWTMDITCLDGDGDAINLTSATLQFRMKSGSTTVMTRTNGDGCAISVAASGTCVVTVTPSHQTTASVTAGKTYKWEFRVTDSNSVVSVQLRGNLTVLESLF